MYVCLGPIELPKFLPENPLGKKAKVLGCFDIYPKNQKKHQKQAKTKDYIDLILDRNNKLY